MIALTHFCLCLLLGGDLADYVKLQKALLKTCHLIQLCKDACSGLAYLEEKNCIHRYYVVDHCIHRYDVVDPGVQYQKQSLCFPVFFSDALLNLQHRFLKGSR